MVGADHQTVPGLGHRLRHHLRNSLRERLPGEPRSPEKGKKLFSAKLEYKITRHFSIEDIHAASELSEICVVFFSKVLCKFRGKSAVDLGCLFGAGS